MKSLSLLLALASSLAASSPAWSQTPPTPAAPKPPQILECPAYVFLPRDEGVKPLQGWQYNQPSEFAHPPLAFMTYVMPKPGVGNVICHYDGLRGALFMALPAGCTPKRIGKWLDNRPSDRYIYMNQPYCSVKAAANTPRLVCQLECP